METKKVVSIYLSLCEDERECQEIIFPVKPHKGPSEIEEDYEQRNESKTTIGKRIAGYSESSY